MEMTQNLNPNTLDTPTPQGKDFRPFVDLIFTAGQEIRKRFKAPAHIIDQEAAEILYLSYLASPPDEWVRRFIDARTKAVRFFRNAFTYWRTLAYAAYIPAIENECKQFIPSFDPQRYTFKPSHIPAPQKVAPQPTPKPKRKPAHKRGQLWKLDDRWDDLWPSDKKIFSEGCRRAQIPQKEDAFPWAELGVQSLSKKTEVSPHQVKRCRFHLCELGLWSRIKQGYKDHGASRYHIFFTPEMSSAFFTKRRGKGKRRMQKRTSKTR